MKKLFSISNLIIGITLVILGIRWMIVDEPWMLDKVANEERLGMTFDKLFENEINQTLPNYLKQIYRFFGLWVTTVGMLITSFTIVTRLGTTMARGFIQVSFFITLLGVSIIEYIFIPTSHFVYLTFVLWVLWGLSVWAGIKLKKYDI